MTKLYIVRHGQTDENIKNACIGRSDVPLNGIGVSQARKLADKFSDVNFEAVYTSPLVRAVNTAAPIAAMHRNLNLIMNYGLIERDFGEWEGMTRDEIRQKRPNAFRRESDLWFYETPPGGESIEELYKRCADSADKIIAQHEGGEVLMMTHLLTARSIITHLTGLPPKCCDRFFLDNAKTAVIEYSDGQGTLLGLNI